MSEIPVRCFTCRKPITKWKKYSDLRREGMDISSILKRLKIVAPCCKVMYTTHIDVLTTHLRQRELQTQNMKNYTPAISGGIDEDENNDE